jgi:hypothetical protein
MNDDIPIFDSWQDSPCIPQDWQPAKGPYTRIRVAIKNRSLLHVLKLTLPGKWMKVYLKGVDGSEIHFFEHESGKAAFVKHKPRET